MATESNVFIMMGVCGCGKTTVSMALKDEIEKRFKNKIQVSFIDGDDLHPLSNKSKMEKGIALNDNDRKPWLIAIRQKIDQHKSLIIDNKTNNKIRHLLFIACSALKYKYREILRGHLKNKYHDLNTQKKLAPNNVTFIMLDGKSETLQKRLNNRDHEYMPSTLLQSQLNALEYPNTKYIENDIIIQPIEPSLTQISQTLINKIVLTHKNITNWRQTQRISSIVGEYKIWYLSQIETDNDIGVHLFLELMNLYSINECIDDFVGIYRNIESKGNIKNLLDIDKRESMLYKEDKFTLIMNNYDNHNQKLYLLTLHCILCYFAEIPMIKNKNIQTLDDRFVEIILNENNAKIDDIDSDIKTDIDELNTNLFLFNDEEKSAIKLLLEMNQDFIFKKWDKPGINDRKKKELLHQIIKLNKQYPGGLKQYYLNAVKLITDSSNNVNPYKGWKVDKADNINIEFDSNEFIEYEDFGSKQMGYCGFVLLGGGFGERLGFNGIKTGLPSEITTETSYIELYIKTLLAFQERARCDLNKSDLLLPFACTTSGIGHNLTKQLLEKNNYFGLDIKQNQFTFLPQELVASFSNNKCEFALEEKDNYKIIEKPHGHGDVHSLMYQTGTAQKWLKNGIKWIICLQDTNAVAIRSLLSTLGVSYKNNFAMNSIGTPRLPGQSYGAICKLINNDNDDKQQELTINIEYNQLNALLGDKGDTLDEKTGFSPYPANTNTLIIRSDTYCEVLSKTQGMVTEFVNPKYVDNIKRDKFEKATRLECMMQEYPKLLFEMRYNEKIGVTTLPKWIALQPVKKNIFDSQNDAKMNKNNMAEFCAANGESSIYFANRKYMNSCNVILEGYDENELKMFNGINIKYGARIVLLPSFGISLNEIKQRLIGKNNIKITKNSTLILDGNIIIKKLYLNGALIIKSHGNNTKIIIDGVKVENKGWNFNQINNLNDKNINDIYKLRGYTLQKLQQTLIQFNDGKQHIICD